MIKNVFFAFFVISILFNCASTGSNVLTKDGKRKRLLVENFEHNNNSKLKLVSSGLSSGITNGLSRIESLEVIGPAEKRSALKALRDKQLYGEDVDPTEFLSKLTSADYYCNGDMQLEDNIVLVNARISDSRNGKLMVSTSTKGNINRPISLQEKVISNLLFNIDEKDSKANITKAIQTSTKNEKAYSYYVQGSELLFSNPKDAAINFVEALKNDPEYIDAIEDLSNSLFQIGDYKSSLKYMLIKHRLMERKGLENTLEYSNTLCNLGVLNFYLGDKKSAYDFCYRDKELKETNKWIRTKSYSVTLQTLGSFHIMEKNYKQGITYLEQSRLLFISLGLDNSLDFAELLTSLGTAYRQSGNLENAMIVYIKADKLYEELGILNTSSYSSFLGNFGILYLIKKDYKEALRKFIKDKEIQEKLGLIYTTNYVTTLNNMVVIFKELGLSQKASEYSNLSKKISAIIKKRNN